MMPFYLGYVVGSVVCALVVYVTRWDRAKYELEVPQSCRFHECPRCHHQFIDKEAK